MSSLSRGVCVFCRHGLRRDAKFQIQPHSWQPSRSMAQAQRRRPSRMALSPKVAQHGSGKLLTGQRTGGPFGAMNRTSTEVRQPRQTSQTRRQRTERSKRNVVSQKKQSNLKAPPKERETFHALKMQRSLSTVTYSERSRIKARIGEYQHFSDFALLPAISKSIGTQLLSNMVDISPTPIQQAAIPALLGIDKSVRKKGLRLSGAGTMQQYLLAAETGSGKTLAYVLPVIDAIKRAEVAEAEDQEVLDRQTEGARDHYKVDPNSDGPDPYTGRPRAIILVPTSELVDQVGSVVKTLAHGAKFRSALISSAYTAKVIRNRLFSSSGIDVLVTTPHLLASISQSEPNVLSRVTHLVADEADSLFDRSFAPSTSTIIDKSSPSLKQLILCSATIPRNLDSYLRQRFPDIRRLVTPNLHAIPRRVQLSVVDVEKQPYVGNRLLACADTIWSIGKDANTNRAEGGENDDMTRLLVFVNERETTKEVANYLLSKGIDAIALNRDSTEQRQAETLGEFTTPRQAKDGEARLPPPIVERRSPTHGSQQPRRHLPNTKVLVSTDLGSRGIDTLAVRHVLLYDVPHTSVDFIHRLGRTGRMGRRGRGTVLVGKDDRKDIIREVREGMYRGQALI